MTSNGGRLDRHGWRDFLKRETSGGVEQERAGGANRKGLLGAKRSGLVGAKRTGLVGAKRSGLVGAKRSGLVGAKRNGLMGAKRNGLMGAKRSGWWARTGTGRSERSIPLDRAAYSMGTGLLGQHEFFLRFVGRQNVIHIYRESIAIARNVHAFLCDGVLVLTLGFELDKHWSVVVKGYGRGASFFLHLAIVTIGRAADFCRILHFLAPL